MINFNQNLFREAIGISFTLQLASKPLVNTLKSSLLSLIFGFLVCSIYLYDSSRNFVAETFRLENFFAIQLLSGFSCINNLAELAKSLDNCETGLHNDITPCNKYSFLDMVFSTIRVMVKINK